MAIAIIVILASLVLSVTTSAQATARQIECGNQLGQFGKALFMPAIGRPPKFKWWYDAPRRPPRLQIRRPQLPVG